MEEKMWGPKSLWESVAYRHGEGRGLSGRTTWLWSFCLGSVGLRLMELGEKVGAGETNWRSSDRYNLRHWEAFAGIGEKRLVLVCREIKNGVKEGTHFKFMQRYGEEGETQLEECLGKGGKVGKEVLMFCMRSLWYRDKTEQQGDILWDCQSCLGGRHRKSEATIKLVRKCTKGEEEFPWRQEQKWTDNRAALNRWKLLPSASAVQWHILCGTVRNTCSAPRCSWFLLRNHNAHERSFISDQLEDK